MAALELFAVVDEYDRGFIRWAARDEPLGCDEALEERVVPIPFAIGGDRVRVYTSLNDSRYNGRLGTVLEVYGDQRKVRVQLDVWTRGFEPPDGQLYLRQDEVRVEGRPS